MRARLISLFFAFISLMPEALWAAPPVDSPYYAVYQDLSADLAQDVQQFDGITLSTDDRQKTADAWLAYMKNPTQPNPASDPDSPLGKVWPPAPVAAPVAAAMDTGAPALPAQTVAIPALNDSASTIQDMGKYVGERLGTGLSQLLKAGKINVLVYGGNESSLASEMAGRNLERIPSLYESWGIEKYLDVTPGQANPRVIVRIPPIQQYVEHYGMLVQAVGGSLSGAKLNEGDRLAYQAQFHDDVTKMYQQLGSASDYFVLGYGNALKKSLLSDASPWKLASTPKSVTGSRGLSATRYSVVSKTDPHLQRSFVAVSDQNTLWGEASAFLTQALLERKPRGIVFLGSTGGLSRSEKAYDVTVPGDFRTAQGPIALHNDLDRFRPKTQAGLDFIAHHGNADSPLAETLDFTRRLVADGVDSVDVEESRVAQTVAEYNQAHNTDITFSAANVVTDLPVSQLIHEKSDHDLDSVSAAQKENARKLAVDSFLESALERGAWEQNADTLRKQLISKALPGVDPARIYMHDGEGKIDSDPAHKLSYYLFTRSPRNPDSDTYLIPMATSRFDVNNYQTDDWWDAHQDEIAADRAKGLPVPHQDRAEVAAYLKQNGLSTNPDVPSLNTLTGQITREPLREFLLREYLARFSDGKTVTLYRGAAGPEELDSWRAKQFPHGVRYWTPSLDYGWRYGRKVPDFFKLMLQDRTPVFKYEIPQHEFVDLVRQGHLILGTELTKHVHDSFIATQRFQDQLTGYDYMGDGKFGLELEIRADGKARPRFTDYFAGPVTIDELADARIAQIRDGTKRLMLSHPDEADQLSQTEKNRVAQVESERSVFKLLKAGASHDAIQTAVGNLTEHPEIANIDGADLRSFALATTGMAACEMAAMKKLVEEPAP